MRGNLFKCGNEVIIEGQSIGPVAEFEITQEREELANTCVVMVPVFAIGVIPGFPPEQRIRSVLSDINIKPGASIEVYGWYYSNPDLGQEFERVLLFKGFVRQVIGGFPSKLICEDYSFILRFGTIDKDWPARTKLEDMVNYLCPIANDAFKKFRDSNGFSESVAQLSFDSSDSASVEFALQTFKKISPYEALSKLMKMYALYGTVNTEGKVYFGVGVRDRENKATFELATNTNVIARDLVPKDGLFENYKVVASAVLSDGTRYTYEYGDSEGEPHRIFVPQRTEELVKGTAEAVMQNLKGMHNKGTITMVLYPVLDLFDYVKYTDTLLSELSGNYYVIGRSLKMGQDGFTQVITVTDEKFIL